MMLPPKSILDDSAARFRQAQKAITAVRRAAKENRIEGANSPELVGQRRKMLDGLLSGPPLAAFKRIVGRNNLVPISYLERAVQAAATVGRVIIRCGGQTVGYGTAFLVAPRLVLTNHHVLASAETAAMSRVQFNYQDDVRGRPQVAQTFNLEPDALFLTDAALDYTLVAVMPLDLVGRDLSRFGFNTLSAQEGKAMKGELLNIIQHPNGEPKQLAIRENRLVDIQERFLWYETDTAPGSSGSPVFNDQWQVIALHHSGVPRKDADGNVLKRDGTPADETTPEYLIDWIANEGVRVSRILAHVRQQALSERGTRLLETVLGTAPTASSAPPTDPMPAATDSSPSIIQGAPTAPLSKEPPELRQTLIELQAGRRADYYDAAADARDREQYYQGVATPGSADLFAPLSRLITDTHRTELPYRPHQYLYNLVDIRPDGKLHSIYTDEAFDPEQLIRESFRLERQHAELREALDRGAVRRAAGEALALDENFSVMESRLPYNCEHSVPKSWFGLAMPMVGDLHHLFTCESGCNSFRYNWPYGDFGRFTEERTRPGCGELEQGQFEPVHGKGVVARAAFYFLIRYPGKISNNSQHYTPASIDMFRRWHTLYPVTPYERHRNVSISGKQGNRNPLIDFPEWVGRINFVAGLG